MPAPARTATSRRFVLPVVIGAGIVLAACAHDDLAERRDSIVAATEEAYAASHRASAPPDTADSSAKSRAPTPLTDENILARVAQNDRLEVQVARIAVGKATSPALKAFARQIADNHSAGESDARLLARRLKLTEKPAVTDTTKVQQQHLVARLTALPKGMAFDTAYVRHLVDGHALMIRDTKAMEGTAADADVKRLLGNSLPEVQRHLDRARVIGKALTAK